MFLLQIKVFSSWHIDNIPFTISNVFAWTVYYFRMFVFKIPIEHTTLAWRLLK